MTVKFRLTSDLHLEALTHPSNASAKREALARRLPVMDDEHEQILLLAGDIITLRALDAMEEFFQDISARFPKILYIPGNHEFWYGKVPEQWAKFVDKIEREWGLTNFYFQDHEILLVDVSEDVRVIASTLWTDFDGGNPLSMTYAHSSMVDYETTYTASGAKLTPVDVLGIHHQQRSVLLGELAHAKHIGKKTLVMTHHAPLRESTAPRWKGHAVNGAFASNMGEEIAALKPDVWAHGHMHDAISYVYGDTNMFCNPCGYPGETFRNGYNPKLVIEL